jgi:hypothetical protein
LIFGNHLTNKMCVNILISESRKIYDEFLSARFNNIITDQVIDHFKTMIYKIQLLFEVEIQISLSEFRKFICTGSNQGAPEEDAAHRPVARNSGPVGPPKPRLRRRWPLQPPLGPRNARPPPIRLIPRPRFRHPSLGEPPRRDAPHRRDATTPRQRPQDQPEEGRPHPEPLPRLVVE